MANLITGQTHLSGLGGSPHSLLPWFPPLAIASRQGKNEGLHPSY
ncbi:hypothetical protein [Moorena sp. SIO4E2]|nr:hypothetical protein [Moorena sp. SIO4E2]